MKIHDLSRKNRTWNQWSSCIAASLLAAALAGCGSDSSAPVVAPTPPIATPPTLVTPPTKEAVALAATISGETCSTCHNGTVARDGNAHQTEFDTLYQNGKLKVTAMAIATNGAGKTTLTFNLKNGTTAVDCKKTANFTVGAYYAPYDAATNTFNYSGTSLMALKPTISATSPEVVGVNQIISNPATGDCTFIKTFTTAPDLGYANAIATADGVISVYGADEVVEVDGSIRKSKYPFAGILRKGAAMGVAVAPYVSASNVTGCENCHTQPFNKHAYIPGQVDDNTPGAAAGTTQQFYVCKTCHYDTRSGGHQFWQLLQEAKLADKTTAAGKALRDRAVAVDGGAALTAAETTKYAYKTRLMNDVHMSHAMEFAYPQSMRNCVACHSGKMDATTGIFKPANFTGETCISCHSFDGITAKMKAAPYNHSAYVTDTATLKAAKCTLCHDGATAPSFSKLHTGGFDPLIYDATGARYSTAVTASVDSATFSGNVLTVKFSAVSTMASLKADSIVPTLIIGPYGYNSKDFVVAPHNRDADGNRLLEYPVDGKTKNPRFTTVSAAGGKWEVAVDMSGWASMITDGTIKRVEIAVLPAIKDAAGKTLGLNAPSKTFDLTTKAFVAAPADIINVLNTAATTSSGYKTFKGCNTCHDQLATTFHSGDRGGNITVCRLCHVKSSGGSHLEMQSRSIDSYIHSIHTFQYFDLKNVDFADTFEAMEYKHHTSTEFPRFGAATYDCQSCHKSGTYNTVDVSKSLPGLLSASDAIKGKTRNIGTVPSYVTGPAATACGACHRSQKIIADDAGGLITLFNHWKQNGYLLENIDTLWDATVQKVMAPFK